MISILHPSRGRPEQAAETMAKWLRLSDTCPEYILMTDSDDRINYNSYKIYVGNHFHVGENKSAIEAINNAAKIATGNILIVISDDFDCPEHWDTLLLEALRGKSDFCAKTIDGHQDWIITLPIMDRIYYNRFGYIYYPGYKHMHSDLEMTCVAWMLGRYIELPLTFKHNHYSVIGQQPDAINRKNNATWGQGQMLFRKRKASNFGIYPIQGLPDLKQHFV